MVEVIQRAPRPNNNNNNTITTTQTQPQPQLHHLTLPTVLEDRDEVEITLSPVDHPSDLQQTGQAPGVAEEKAAQDSAQTGGP